MDWFEAQTYCRSLGGHLAEFDHDSEALAMQTYLMAVFGKFMWPYLFSFVIEERVDDQWSTSTFTMLWATLANKIYKQLFPM